MSDLSIPKFIPSPWERGRGRGYERSEHPCFLLKSNFADHYKRITPASTKTLITKPIRKMV